MSDTTFIYALCEPDTGEVRYIGKADDPDKRLWQHLHNRRHPGLPKAKWIRELVSVGLWPVMKVIAEVPKDCWETFEKYHIQQAKDAGFQLLNVTLGGDGYCSGEAHPNWGKPLSRNVKKKMSEARLGIPLSMECRAKMSAARVGRPKSLAHRQKIGESNRGKRPSAASLLALRAANKGRMLTAEHRRKLSMARAGRKIRTGTCRFVGVIWDKSGARWKSQISIDNHHFSLGSYTSAIDAAYAYDWVANLFNRPTNESLGLYQSQPQPPQPQTTQ